MMLPPPCFDHLPRRRLSDVKHAGQVDRDDAVPSLGIDLQEIEPVADPGQFEHDVEPAELAHDGGNRRIDRHDGRARREPTRLPARRQHESEQRSPRPRRRRGRCRTPPRPRVPAPRPRRRRCRPPRPQPAPLCPRPAPCRPPVMSSSRFYHEARKLARHAAPERLAPQAGTVSLATSKRCTRAVLPPAIPGLACSPSGTPSRISAALPSRRRVQAQRQIERRGGGPERLVFGLVVAPVLEWILGDHRAGEAQAGGAPESARCYPS